MPHRVTVDFSDEAYEAVDTIAKKLDTSKSEALRRALGLFRFVMEERNKGAKLILEGPKRGERREIIQL
jgi:predicted transcriptional regulator